ncbi:Enolase-phosphatase E1 [Posidoniimonas polymericola]|uniref:Enolase-phosphatase E1 n=1 Tax=Posidoniimonas polymericola TaxID=2528002 RepID=A0A5C5YQK6_9BACT|nr:acireductone synthase [Posidoniimonas polymericola]TWT77196.1 Enolase-phosphatase E1 [Posidoniimonas polymericola]
MINAQAAGVLMDVEGTTSSVKFVYDVMFPFARRELAAYLAQAWGEPACQAACEQIAADAGHASLEAWSSTADAAPRDLVETEATRLMDADQKATGLKQLQGLIWKNGFDSGEMVAHVYPDVPPALDRWRAAGADLRIYSSGSIQAQNLFFGHTQQGDLLPLLSGHYDTTTGPKREAASYTSIAADWGLAPASILFLSDITAELDAARDAGLQTALLLRPDNAPVEPGHGHAEVSSFGEIEVRP